MQFCRRGEERRGEERRGEERRQQPLNLLMIPTVFIINLETTPLKEKENDKDTARLAQESPSAQQKDAATLGCHSRLVTITDT
ncbi:hypothetical protein EYF80_000801 [Liparis tanakae]|uniref:Uncharacterized protein n=1 Tax=Liparis tanakae TaxID=230148 RepID=A0A4Z2JGE4_9TELE|nr:hypothetical protein EYF80_000801 [Liparis tanakae]